MITSARPIAINRSRVQTRISLRKECPAEDASSIAPEVNAGAEASGTVGIKGFRSSVLCIFRCLVFITWASRTTPDVALPDGDSDNGCACSGGWSGRVALSLDAGWRLTVACCGPGDALKHALTALAAGLRSSDIQTPSA